MCTSRRQLTARDPKWGVALTRLRVGFEFDKLASWHDADLLANISGHT